MFGNKEVKAYMTVEASFVFPFVIGIIYLLVMAGLILFSRCINSQKVYLKDLKSVRITNVSQVSETVYSDIDFEEYRTESGVYSINPLKKISEDRNGY